MMNFPPRSSTCAVAGAAASAGSSSRMVLPSISSERSLSGASETPSMMVAPRMRSIEGVCASLDVSAASARTPATRKTRAPRATRMVNLPIGLVPWWIDLSTAEPSFQCWKRLLHRRRPIQHTKVVAPENNGRSLHPALGAINCLEHREHCHDPLRLSPGEHHFCNLYDLLGAFIASSRTG